MKRPTYPQAVEWIAAHAPTGIPHWTAIGLVAFLFGVSEGVVKAAVAQQVVKPPSGKGNPQ